MKGYRLSDIAAIVGGRLLGVADGLIFQLVTDSRRLTDPEHALFVALVGEKRDGHRYIQDLIRRDVQYFLVSWVPENPPASATFILVEDTLAALQALAAYHRNRFGYPVVGVTGSNGKTIVKEWLHFLLQEHVRMVRSPKSYNSQIGVPLSVWLMEEQAELAVFEAGISQTGEMARLERIIRPTIGLFTNIGDAHREGFSSQREKIQEKLRLFRHTDILIYCADYTDLDDEIQNGFNVPGQIRLSWARDRSARFSVFDIPVKTGTEITLKEGLREWTFTIPFSDAMAVENAVHCAVCLIHLGWDKLLAERMPLLPTLSMRLEMRSGVNRCSLINDSYSNDLRSLRMAMAFMQQQRPLQQQTVILSDIPETGMEEEEVYRTVRRLLDQFGIKRLIGIGPAFIRQQGVFRPSDATFWVSTEAFLEGMTAAQFRDERILIKGARRFGLERISRMLEEKRHQTSLTVNLSALAYNLAQYRKRLAASTRIMAVVKAFSYGSGAHEIASLLQFHQVDYLAVAYADEGVQLRKAGISVPVMVMNPEPAAFDQLTEFNLEPEIYSFEGLDAFCRFLESEGLRDFPVHIKIDTGMHRLGFDPAEVEALGRQLVSAGLVKVMSVFTHLTGSESPEEDAFTRYQQEQFDLACALLRDCLDYPFLRHVSNTAGIVRHPQLQYEMVRLGIGLYGVDAAAVGISLREAATLTTTIAQIRKVKAGETVGYNRKGLLTRDSTIATIRIGYADGYPRSLGNGRGSVMIRGRLCPVVGSVCMDMTMVDITDAPETGLMDEVVLFGNGLSVVKLAQWADTIPYEIMTGISPRVNRVYIED